MSSKKRSKKEKVVLSKIQSEEPANLIPSLALKVGNTSFAIPIDCIKRFPNTTLGALLMSFEDTSPTSDLDFPERNPSVFEKIVVPFYTNDGSLEQLQASKIIEIQSELDFWGIPTSAQSLLISVKDLQAITKEREEKKKSAKKVANTRLTEARAEQRIAESTLQAFNSATDYTQILLDEMLSDSSPDSLIGSDKLLYNYWVSVVGAERIKFVRRLFEYKDGCETDLPNVNFTKEEQEDDFYDSGAIHYYNEEKEAIEQKRRWEELMQRAQDAVQYGHVHSEFVHQHGTCISTRQGEYNDETYPTIEIYEIYVMIVSWKE